MTMKSYRRQQGDFEVRILPDGRLVMLAPDGSLITLAKEIENQQPQQVNSPDKEENNAAE
jgi:hypothetical protein